MYNTLTRCLFFLYFHVVTASLALALTEFGHEFEKEVAEKCINTLDIGMSDIIRGAYNEGDGLKRGLRMFVKYDRTHAEVEQEKLRKADERVSFLEFFDVHHVPDLDLFENCETKEDKLERVERMLAFFSLNEDEMNWAFSARTGGY